VIRSLHRTIISTTLHKGEYAGDSTSEPTQLANPKSRDSIVGRIDGEAMTREQATELVNRAIDALVENDPELLDLDVTERALAHQLATYIARDVPKPLSVDCEYNRHFGDPKRLQLPKRDALDREVRATTVFPDIIVHERNTDDHNYVVLELKKPGEDLDYDELKLRAFHRELGYLHTAHLVLGLDRLGHLVREVFWID
jgi:hypothetical protein